MTNDEEVQTQFPSEGTPQAQMSLSMPPHVAYITQQYYPPQQVVIVQEQLTALNNCLFGAYWTFLTIITVCEVLFFGLFLFYDTFFTLGTFTVLIVITVVAIVGFVAKNEPCLIIVASIRLGWVVFVSIVVILFCVLCIITVFTDPYEFGEAPGATIVAILLIYGVPSLFYILCSISYIVTAIKVAILFHRKKGLVHNLRVQNIEMSNFEPSPAYV